MISVRDIVLSVGGHDLLVGASLEVNPGDHLGLVGRNGTGKTTLLRAIVGELLIDSGRIEKRPGLSVGWLPQQAVSGSVRPVWDEVASGMTAHHALKAAVERAREAVEKGVPSAVEKLGDAEEAFRQAGGYAADERIGEVLHGLGFSPESWRRSCDTFSGGWQMRIALARLLLSDADIYLLDEPTNHLDLQARAWLASFLKGSSKALIVVSHDRHLLDAATNRTAEIRDGQITVYNGNFSAWVKERAQRAVLLAAQAESQQKEAERLRRFVERFKAKATKAAQARSRQKMLDKMEMIDAPAAELMPRFKLPPAPESSHETIGLKGVAVGWEPGKPVVRNVEAFFARGMRVALLGPNGIGKSTILHALSGKLPLQAGRRNLGEHVRIGVFTQDLAQDLPPDSTGLEHLLETHPEAPLTKAWAAIGGLGLRGESAERPIGVLSGGEKARVALAAFALRPHNVLLLDEPTNHLDAVTVEVLAEALKTFEGTLVFVSHDRWFVEQVATHVLLVNPEGSVLREGVRSEDFLPPDRSGGSSGGPAAGAVAFAEQKRVAREKDRARKRVDSLALEVERAEAMLGTIDEAMIVAATDFSKLRKLQADRAAQEKVIAGLWDEWAKLEEMLA